MSNQTPTVTGNDELLARIEAQQARQTPSNRRPAGGGAPSSKSRKAATNRAQRWMRFVHVYMSMIAFLIILFFGVTGLLLNHPSWLGGDEIVTTEFTGTLPTSVIAGDGVEFLAVSEYLRSEVGVTGEVTNFDQVGTTGSINYTGPSYGASVRFDTETLAYDVTVRSEGFVNAMRDLHSGRDTGGAWSLAIDISAVFLVVVSISGLGIQLFMRKRRTKALLWLAAGSVLSIGLIWFAMV